jgi:serine/threonine protein kinase
MEGVADYAFVRALGEGGHGSFYLAMAPARLRTDSEYVGVKVLRGANDPDGLRRATRELRAFAAVESPFLVRLLDAGRDGDHFFYAMEYCAGGSLEEPAEPLDRSAVLVALAQAARGAGALHALGLVHRAIKPANVLLHPDGARLADLGLADAFQPGQTMTGLGEVTAIEYVEPGLLAGEPATPATDIWSLGITLHRALAGEGVYGDMPEGDPLLCVRKVLSRRPTLSDRLEARDAAIIEACLAPDVADRPASALDLAATLEALALA